MSVASATPLISPEALAARLDDPRLFVLDIRPRPAFEAGHVPGAVHSGYDEGWRVAAEGAPGLLPPPDALAHLLGGIGLVPENDVVLVSAGGGASDLAGAARVYWTLKTAGHRSLSVLDGGHRAWAADPRRPVAAGPEPFRPPGRYPVAIDETWRSSLAAAEAALRRGSATFVDARSEAHYAGRETAASVRAAGHIPGAVSRDYEGAVEPGTGRLLPRARLEERFAGLGEGPVITYCNTGHTAALDWFVLSEVLGRPGVTLFDGSMSQWSADPARPVER
ncbi:MAG: rhodanese-like domain-containing protein [Microvirga sp.]